MSCPNCDCDPCLDAHPISDEEQDDRDREFAFKRLRQMFGRNGMYSNIPEYYQTLDVAFMASATRHAANDLRRLAEGIVAGLDRIQMLIEDDSVDGL